jgi:hypothetical protein
MADPIFDGVFDELFAPGAHIGVGADDYSLTQDEYKTGYAFTILGGNRSGAGVNLPVIPIGKVSVWRADPANSYSVFVRSGVPIELVPGARLTIITDKKGRISAANLGTAAPATGWQTIDDDQSPFSAVAGQHLDIDSRNGIVSVVLPLNPDKFAELFFRNGAQSLATHKLTMVRNGQTIMALAENMDVNTPGAEFSIWFNGHTWQFPGAQF